MLTAALRPVMAIRRVVLGAGPILVEAEGAAAGAACPACGAIGRRVHDRYRRRPLDLPWRGRMVRLVLTVRSCCCDNPRCPRATFSEDFGAALPRRARRTTEATACLVALAGTGGEAGARLGAALGLPVSPDTLLRLRRTANPALAARVGDAGGADAERPA